MTAFQDLMDGVVEIHGKLHRAEKLLVTHWLEKRRDEMSGKGGEDVLVHCLKKGGCAGRTGGELGLSST